MSETQWKEFAKTVFIVDPFRQFQLTEEDEVTDKSYNKSDQMYMILL